MDKELLLPDPEQQAQAARHPREDGSRSQRTYKGKGGQNGMNNDKKPSWKERLSNWAPTDIMVAAVIITAINVSLVVFQILWWLLR